MEEKDTNSFKDLENLHSEDFKSKSDSIKLKIESETSTFRYLGDIIDLYFSKVMNVFIAMTGGGDENSNESEEK